MNIHRILRICWVYILTKCGKAINVWSSESYPANVLSNLYPNAFEIDGIECASMEGFLQSLKYEDPEVQKAICALSGHDAKDRSISDWQSTQIIYWQGTSIHRQSADFQALLLRAYQSLFHQNETFHAALLATRGKRIYHTRGLADPRKTILTEKEFCEFLMNVRK